MILRDHIKTCLQAYQLKIEELLHDIDSLSDANLLYRLEKIWTLSTIPKSFQNFLADDIGLGDKTKIVLCVGETITPPEDSHYVVAQANTVNEAQELFGFYELEDWLIGLYVSCDVPGFWKFVVNAIERHEGLEAVCNCGEMTYSVRKRESDEYPEAT